MRVLLVNVSRDWEGRVYSEYPLGLGMLATKISSLGHDVHIYDMAVDKRTIEDVTASYKPQVTGFSFLSTSAGLASKIIARAKNINAGHLVAGGIHSTIFPSHVLDMGASIVVSGEGEPVIGPLLEALENLDPGEMCDMTSLAHIPGISYRNYDGTVCGNPVSPESVDLDREPAVNRALFDLSLYSHHSIISSRGCRYNCKFCCSWGPGGKRGRTTSPSRMVDEIESICNMYGNVELYFADDMFFYHDAPRLEFCDLLKKRGLPVQWVVQLRADDMNERLAVSLLESGCKKVCIGAESGSNKILKSCGKGLTRSVIIDGIRVAIRAGLQVKTWWIIGLPGGGLSDQLEGIDVIGEAKPNEVAIHTFVPLPGTYYWKNADKCGIVLPKLEELDDLYYYCKPEALNLNYMSVSDMKYAINRYDSFLELNGYVPTDKASIHDKYKFTSPSHKTTFPI